MSEYRFTGEKPYAAQVVEQFEARMDRCPTCGGTKEEPRMLTLSGPRSCGHTSRLFRCTDPFHDREDG